MKQKSWITCIVETLLNGTISQCTHFIYQEVSNVISSKKIKYHTIGQIGKKPLNGHLFKWNWEICESADMVGTTIEFLKVLLRLRKQVRPHSRTRNHGLMNKSKLFLLRWKRKMLLHQAKNSHAFWVSYNNKLCSVIVKDLQTYNYRLKFCFLNFL